MNSTTTLKGGRCAGCGGRPPEVGRCFCAPCLAHIACTLPLSRPTHTPQWRAPGAGLRPPEEVTTIAYA